MHIMNSRGWYLLKILLLMIMFTNGEITMILITENKEINSTIQSTTSESITNAESVITSSKDTTFDTTETMTTTSEICSPDISNSISVVNRTSTMFTAFISYNCSSINSSELFVFVNETLATNCYISGDSDDNSTINVTCDPIENNAGRNWTFTIGRRDLDQEIIFNETFTITLTPLSLDTLTNITVEIADDLTSASILIPNCLGITNPEFLIFRCNSSDLSNNILSDNCTYTCSNLEPGSIYNASLIRLAIPIVDESNNTFEEESLHTIYITDVDKVTNLSFHENSTLISFDHPRGSYDNILLSCFAQDQHCSNDSLILTNSTTNCSSCTSISIPLITKGVTYKCQAITIKENFPNITSDDLIFETPLESIIYEKASQHWFSYSHRFIFNVTTESDFDYIDSYCSMDRNQAFPCSDLTIDHEQCSTILKYDGIRGCNYQCYFITKKINYSEKYSKNYTMELFPPKPNIYLSGKGSRSISIQWTFDAPVYVKYYKFLRDRALVETVNRGIFSYNYTKLLPNQEYQLDVQLIANHASFSDPMIVGTLEEAPAIPTTDDINKKIIPLSNDTESKSEQFVIELDLSLFSNQYGFVYSYQIYVRQDQKKNTSKLDEIGTYSAAMKNESLDYLALIIPLSSSKNSFWKSTQKLRIIIGNESVCKDNFNPSIPCNGKLKIEKNYKLVINGCANPGCTSVLSQAFRTINKPTTELGSKGWMAILPILIGLILGGFGIWKRRELKSFYQRKIRKSGRYGETKVTYNIDQSKISLSPTIYEIRPKFLIEYINMTHADEKAIYAEYKELETMNPQTRQSISESNYEIYNRYSNIAARGAWDRTAVRLTGHHRLHDYINANEIESYDHKKQYIASQGPLKETCQDFWDMIVQYTVPTIVMLTKTDERNSRNPIVSTSKCYHYFPMNIGQFLVFGGLMIKVTDLEVYHNSDLEIRYITVKKEGGMEHRLIHYYYTGWPDYNVVEPRKLLSLIETINKHREYLANSNEKTTRILSARTVVHCSAGVGRTGTYIAVETIMRLLDQPKGDLLTMKIDVMGIVYQLRRDRGKMVQTKEQYLLIHRCIEEYLKQTRRLDIISKRLTIHQNGHAHTPRSSENVPMRTSKSNSRISSSSSTIDSNTHYIYPGEERSLPSRSSLPMYETNGHRDRINIVVGRSTHDLLDEQYHSSIEYDDRRDATQPPIPPRQSRCKLSSKMSQQSET